jgi:hypothetical protein
MSTLTQDVTAEASPVHVLTGPIRVEESGEGTFLLRIPMVREPDAEQVAISVKVAGRQVRNSPYTIRLVGKPVINASVLLDPEHGLMAVPPGGQGLTPPCGCVTNPAAGGPLPLPPANWSLLDVLSAMANKAFRIWIRLAARAAEIEPGAPTLDPRRHESRHAGLHALAQTAPTFQDPGGVDPLNRLRARPDIGYRA